VLKEIKVGEESEKGESVYVTRVDVVIGRVGFEFRLSWINLYIVFFRILIDFYWIECYLISGQVRFESNRINLIFF
jgi:hypothetical protein